MGLSSTTASTPQPSQARPGRSFRRQSQRDHGTTQVFLMFLALVAVALMVYALYCLEQLERGDGLIGGGCVSLIVQV